MCRYLLVQESKCRPNKAASNQNPGASMDQEQLEFLFEDDQRFSGIPLGTRLRYGTGSCYLGGLAIGGTYGLMSGLLDVKGITPRLKLNCVLNSCANYGPMVANSFGIISLMYNLIHGASMWSREGREDVAGSVGSAFLAGFLFKIPRGLRPGFYTGSLLGLSMLAFHQVSRSIPLFSPVPT